MGAEIKNTRDSREQCGEFVMHGRREARLCGVTEVVNFDDTGVHLKSVDGELYIEGEELKIGTLDTESGVVSLCGKINAIYYATDSDRKKGFWSRLVR